MGKITKNSILMGAVVLSALIFVGLNVFFFLQDKKESNKDKEESSSNGSDNSNSSSSSETVSEKEVEQTEQLYDYDLKTVLEATPELIEFNKLLEQDPELNTLIAAKEIDYTIFIPSEEKIKQGVVSKENLKDYIVEGNLTSTELEKIDGTSITAISGKKLEVKIVSGNILINDVKITIPDNSTQNGTIHLLVGSL